MGSSKQEEAVVHSFIAEKFKDDKGEFDESKTLAFLEEIRQRRSKMQQQVHDTRYSERILREVHTHRQALKNAHKKSTFGEMTVLRGLDCAVLPKAQMIADMIAQGKPQEDIQLAAEDFVRAYSPYEMPVSYQYACIECRRYLL